MKKSEFIPYQKCPVCEGTKRIWVNQFDPCNTASTVGWQNCGVCNGAGIIPMFVNTSIIYKSEPLKEGRMKSNTKN